MSSHVTTWVLELVDKVSSPFKKMTRWAKSAYKDVGKIDKQLDLLGKKSSALNRRLTKLTIGAAAFGVLTMGSLQFEQGMRRANTMLEVGEDQLAVYTAQVQDLGLATGKTKTELADGLYNVISAGVPKENVISFLTRSTKAAVGGTSELGIVVNATAAVIKNYGDAWESAGAIQDKFQKTVQLGQINGLGELASALPRVTGLAADLGVQQTELLGVFATTSGVVGKSAEVSTMLSAALNALLKPSAEAVKISKKLGIAFDATVVRKSGGLKNYIDLLIPKIQAYSKATGKSQEEIIGSLFGSAEAIKLVMKLGGNLGDSWAKNTNDIAGAAGSVDKAFGEMMKSSLVKFSQARTAFGNNIDLIIIHLAPLINGFLNVFMTIAKFTFEFMKSHPVLTKFIVIGSILILGLITLATITSIVSVKTRIFGLMIKRTAIQGGFLSRSLARAALMSLRVGRNMGKAALSAVKMGLSFALTALQGIGSFIVSIVAATAAQWGFNIAMNANPLGLIVIGIIAVVGVVALLIKYWDKIKQAIVNFAKFIIKNHPFAWLIRLIDKVFPGFKDAIKDIFSSVIDWFKKMWDSISGVWDSITSFFGFGDSSAEVIVKKEGDDDDDPEDIDLLDLDNAGGDLDIAKMLSGGKSSNTDVTGLLSTGESGGIGGSSEGSGKTITMNLDIKNIFNMSPGNWRDNVDDIANEIVGKINDHLKDGIITAG
jgi:TP901 family phage tail tape measure protein